MVNTKGVSKANNSLTQANGNKNTRLENKFGKYELVSK